MAWQRVRNRLWPHCDDQRQWMANFDLMCNLSAKQARNRRHQERRVGGQRCRGSGRRRHRRPSSSSDSDTDSDGVAAATMSVFVIANGASSKLCCCKRLKLLLSYLGVLLTRAWSVEIDRKVADHPPGDWRVFHIRDWTASTSPMPTESEQRCGCLWPALAVHGRSKAAVAGPACAAVAPCSS